MFPLKRWEYPILHTERGMDMEHDYVNIECGAGKFAYYLKWIKETSRSIYAESELYGYVYRIEKKTNIVYIDGKFWAVAERISVL